jgi:DNA (cytosine-5)-methyltransferase 1
MRRTFVSLFSGAGGLDQGFVRSGWKPVFMIDNWGPAVDTLRLNHHTDVYGWDLSAIPVPVVKSAFDNAETYRKHIDCVIGCPPCQPLSRLNQNQLFRGGKVTKHNLNDPRRSLFMDFIRIVEYIRPPFLVMENVFDIKSRKLGGVGPQKNELMLTIILQEFEKAGYSVESGVLDASHYNVPQKRRRMVFIGVRNDLGFKPSLPASEGLSTSVRQEFDKINPFYPNQERKECDEEWKEKVSHIPPGGYYNSLPTKLKVLKPVNMDFVKSYSGQVREYCVEHNGSFTEFKVSSHISGERVVFLTGHQSPVDFSKISQMLNKGGKLLRIMPRMGTYLRRIKWDVSHTITRNPLIHPEENRELTVREKAAIQTFSPNYEFCGTRSDQHVLVGNAVPCNLGSAIARHLEEISK